MQGFSCDFAQIHIFDVGVSKYICQLRCKARLLLQKTTARRLVHGHIDDYTYCVEHQLPQGMV